MSVTSNAGEVSKDFTKVIEAVSGSLERAFIASCIAVSADAKKNQKPHIDTGLLNKSIEYEIEQEGNTLIGVIGTNTEYAAAHEFGTVKSKAYPFLTPALESNRALINKLLASAVKEGTS